MYVEEGEKVKCDYEQRMMTKQSLIEQMHLNVGLVATEEAMGRGIKIKIKAKENKKEVNYCLVWCKWSLQQLSKLCNK